VIGTGKREAIDLIQPYPAVVHRTIQGDLTGDIPTAEDVHDDSKMGIGVLDTADEPGYFNRKVDLFPYLPEACFLRGLPLFDLPPGKLP
jgi:hypothetical protein